MRKAASPLKDYKMYSGFLSREFSRTYVVSRFACSAKFARALELSLASFSLIVAVLAQVLYAVHFYKPHFQSDDAVLSMLAESMWEQGTLFPRGWITNNGDLMVPSGALLIAPLISWLPNGFNLHAIAGIFAIVIMLVSAFMFLRQRKVDTPILVATIAMCASGISWYCAHVIYQQTTYLWWPAGFFIGATLICKHREVRASKTDGLAFGAALFLVVSCVSFANPARTFIMLFLPLYAFDRALVVSTGKGSAGPFHYFLDRLGIRD